MYFKGAHNNNYCVPVQKGKYYGLLKNVMGTLKPQVNYNYYNYLYVSTNTKLILLVNNNE